MRKRSKDESLRRFGNQDRAKAFAERTLADHFDIFDEVILRSPADEKFVVDAVAICKEQGYVIGLEYKASSLFMAEFADALRQAANYRDSFIDDPRLPTLRSSQLDCCLVFPDWDGLHDDGILHYGREAEGMRLLAQHFRVGALRVNPNDTLSMVIGQSHSGIWHSTSGWTGNASGVLRGSRRRGSGTKAKDRGSATSIDSREAAKAQPIGLL